MSMYQLNSFRESLIEAMEQIPSRKDYPFKDNPVGNIFRNHLPTLCSKAFNLDSKYILKGSIGQGNFAEIPWLCIFDKNITNTATKGYYIVFLFTSDGSKVHISLNQGWTFFKNKYGISLGKKKIQSTSNRIIDLLDIRIIDGNIGPIQLNATGNLAKGYELGNIISKEYELKNFPEIEIIEKDIRELLGLYAKIDQLRGLRNIDQFNDFLLLQDDGLYLEEKEEEYQCYIQQNEPHLSTEFTNSEPMPRREPVKTNEGKYTYPRRASKAIIALELANYNCEIDNAHKTFISKASNHQYVEAHHLIPMSAQRSIPNELDVPENIISLCPTCHRKIHHGQDMEREALLYQLYEGRRKKLKISGIYVAFEKLCEFYNINNN